MKQKHVELLRLGWAVLVIAGSTAFLSFLAGFSTEKFWTFVVQTAVFSFLGAGIGFWLPKIFFWLVWVIFPGIILVFFVTLGFSKYFYDIYQLYSFETSLYGYLSMNQTQVFMIIILILGILIGKLYQEKL